MSKFIQVRLVMEEATVLQNIGGFFYPYQFDFRFRIYPKPAYCSVHSQQIILEHYLTFKFGKRIGDNFDSVLQ